LRKGGIILSLLVLPLYVPVLIFAASATANAAAGFDPSGQIYMLLAFLLFAISLSPWATAAALRMSVS
jgi:heme exporter protein B